MTEEQALKESIEHWKRMMKWVEDTRDFLERPDLHVMEATLGEDWFSKYCPLCQLHTAIVDEYMHGVDCGQCILGLKIGSCESSDSLWKEVNNAPNWGDWLDNANVFLNNLEKVYFKEYRKEKEEKMEYPKVVCVYPKCEEGVVNIDSERLYGNADISMIGTRTGGNFSAKAFWLSGDSDWVIGRDSNGELVLVPLKKKVQK